MSDEETDHDLPYASSDMELPYQDGYTGLDDNDLRIEDREDRDNLLEHDEEKDNPCKGQLVTWIAGSIWDNYAYGQHDDDRIPFTPIRTAGPDQIALQSKRCKKLLDTDEEKETKTCSKCRALLNSASLRNIMERASGQALPRTNWRFLTLKQLKLMLSTSRKQNKLLGLQVWLAKA